MGRLQLKQRNAGDFRLTFPQPVWLHYNVVWKFFFISNCLYAVKTWLVKPMFFFFKKWALDYAVLS